jgi:bifunctional UDP-N-acetylglucosamine pyrophosphorylase/glucosamine-1-phosphate N-acetyltransferase
MKAVILAAGEGKRLRPITSTRPKTMIPLAGKPYLAHTILGLREAGIKHILLVVGYKEKLIKDYFKDYKRVFDINIEYITQKEYLGTAHAAGHAKDFVNDDPFLLMYGDILVDSTVFKDIIKKFKETKTDGLLSLTKVDNPENFGIISLDSNSFVEKIIEKPAPELNLGNLVNAGIYIFDSMIFDGIEKTKKSIRDEFEITDSMELLINKLSKRIYGFIIKDRFWSDIGLPWQVLEANAYLLNNIKPDILGNVEKNVILSGNIHIEKNTEVRAGTYIQGPCYIGEDCIIGPNAFIRPYTSIGNNCHIGISEVKNSLIFSNTDVPHFNYVGDSIICENVNLGAGTKLSNLRFDNKSIKMNINGRLIDSGRRKLGAVIGANSQTGINASIMCGKKIGESSIIGAHTLVNEDVPAKTLYYQDLEGKIVKKSIDK